MASVTARCAPTYVLELTDEEAEFVSEVMGTIDWGLGEGHIAQNIYDALYDAEATGAGFHCRIDGGDVIVVDAEEEAD